MNGFTNDMSHKRAMRAKDIPMRIFVDTEYCYPGMKKTDPRPTAENERKIVQIAAILYDVVHGKEVRSFDQLAKPAYGEKVTPFFEELTGIAQAEIDVRARKFPEVLADFARFCSGYPIWTFDKDEEVFRQNCDYFGMEMPFAGSFVRVKALLPQWGVNPNEYSSGTLYQAANLQMEGHVHNALHDVRSMAAATSYFESL